MMSVTASLTLTLVLLAGLSTVLGECDIEQMKRCVGDTTKVPHEGSKSGLCKKFQHFVECYEVYGRGCDEGTRYMEGPVNHFRSRMQQMECPGVATIEGCHVNRLSDCINPPPSMSAADMCKAVNESKACYETALAGCAPEVKEKYKLQIRDSKMALCDEESSCSITKVKKCLVEMPPAMSSSTPDVLCPKIEPHKTCLTSLLPNCKDEYTQTQIETFLKNFEQFVHMCSKTDGQGEGYETETSGKCNKAKIQKCVERRYQPSANDSQRTYCTNMRVFLDCYEEQGDNCDQVYRDRLRVLVIQYEELIEHYCLETWGECNKAKMDKCVEYYQPSADDSQRTYCINMMDFVDCYEEHGENCDQVYRDRFRVLVNQYEELIEAKCTYLYMPTSAVTGDKRDMEEDNEVLDLDPGEDLLISGQGKRQLNAPNPFPPQLQPGAAMYDVGTFNKYLETQAFLNKKIATYYIFKSKFLKLLIAEKKGFYSFSN